MKGWHIQDYTDDELYNEIDRRCNGGGTFEVEVYRDNCGTESRLVAKGAAMTVLSVYWAPAMGALIVDVED